MSRPDRSRSIRIVALLALLSGSASFVALPASADEPEDRSGFYASLGVTAGFQFFDETGLEDFPDAPGGNLRGGYRFHRWFAAEAQFEYVGTYEETVLSREVEVETFAFHVNGKVPLVSGAFQPYAIVGIGLLSANVTGTTLRNASDGTDFSWRAGGGVDMYMSENWVLGVETAYVSGVGSVDRWEHLALGVNVGYRF